MANGNLDWRKSVRQAATKFSAGVQEMFDKNLIHSVKELPVDSEMRRAELYHIWMEGLITAAVSRSASYVGTMLENEDVFITMVRQKFATARAIEQSRILRTAVRKVTEKDS